jgi:hypothetical protein
MSLSSIHRRWRCICTLAFLDARSGQQCPGACAVTTHAKPQMQAATKSWKHPNAVSRRTAAWIGSAAVAAALAAAGSKQRRRSVCGPTPPNPESLRMTYRRLSGECTLLHGSKMQIRAGMNHAVNTLGQPAHAHRNRYHAQSRDHQVDRPGGGASTSAAAPQHQQQPIQGAAPPLQRPRPPLEPPTQPSPRLWQQQEQPGADSTPSAPKAGRERIRFASSVLEAERENEDNSAASSERGGGGAAVAVRGPGLKAGHPGGGSLAFYKATQLQQQKGGGAGGSGRRGSTSPHESPTGSPR